MSIVIQKKKFSQQNPVEYADRLAKYEKIDPNHQQYLKTLSEFEVNFKKTCNKATLKQLKTVLEKFHKYFKGDDFFITDLSKHGEVSKNEEAIKSDSSLLFGRASDIVHMLADYVVNKRSILVRTRRSFDILDVLSSDTPDVILLCVKILKLFSVINPMFATLLSNKPNFTLKMFELMLQDNKIYFKQVLGILEALFSTNPSLINSSLFPHMQEVLLRMPRKFFARFARVIAILVLDSTESVEFKELQSNFVESKMMKVHSFLLSIPDLIETYAIILEYLKEITEKLMTTTPENLQKRIRYLKKNNLLKDSGISLSYLKPIFEQPLISDHLVHEIFSPKFIIKFIVKKSNLTEILFVISNLLAGMRKYEVQNKLRQLNFMEKVVSPFFDILFHNDLISGNIDDSFFTDESYHSSPIATTRIQLLRIIINFCERDAPNLVNKDLLLSAEEKSVLYTQLIPNILKAHHPNPDSIDLQTKDHKVISEQIGQIQRGCNDTTKPFFTEEVLKGNAFNSVEKKGIISKIISLFSQFPANSNYRFWLASCVESFLRGFNESHQIFVAHSGLLFTLLNQILTGQVNKSKNKQISYDLIGEIIKYNKSNMLLLETICEQSNWMEMIKSSVFEDVIDSNVFLRGSQLSFERFSYNSKNKANQTKDFNEGSKLYECFSKENMTSFNCLADSVDAKTITQENICCINTILIISIFADQRGQLPEYVSSLVTREKKTREPESLLTNLIEVLTIWSRYYTSRTKDQFSLFYATSVPFNHFRVMNLKLQNLLKMKLSEIKS